MGVLEPPASQTEGSVEGNGQSGSGQETAPSTTGASLENTIQKLFTDLSPITESDSQTTQPAPEVPEEGEQIEGNSSETNQEDSSAAEGKTGEEEASQEEGSGLPPEVQKAIDKRIGREVRKTKEAEEKLQLALQRAEEVEARLKALEEKPGQENGHSAKPKNLVDSINDLEKLQEIGDQAENAIGQADQLLLRLKRNPGAVEKQLRNAKIQLTDEDGEEDYSLERMENYLMGVRLNADSLLRRHIPRRSEYLKEEAQQNRVAEQLLPWLKDKATPQYAKSEAVLKMFPSIKTLPHWKIVVGAYVEGLKVLEDKLAQSKAPPKTIPKKPPVPSAQPGAPAASPQAPSRNEQANHALEMSFTQSGKSEDLAKVLESRFKL